MDNKEDIMGFFADEGEIDREAHVIFTYWFECTMDPRTAAANLCSETSTAQWKRHGIDEDFRPSYAAKVVSLDVIDESNSSAFTKNGNGTRFMRVTVRIAHPYCNFGTRLPNLLTVALGEGAFFCHGITTIKLIDIEFPNSFLANFEGPRFGTRGIRDILGVKDRPLFIGVVKPNIGLDPESFASLAREGLIGGLDAAKDDELLGDAAYSPFDRRMNLIGRTLKEAEDATGAKKMFIANITDEIDRMDVLHDTAVEFGVNAVMINAMAVGLSAVRRFAKRASVPIFAHFDCIAPMSRHPNFGVSTSVITKLERLCGCDGIIMPGFGPRMMTPEEEVLANVFECSRPLATIKSTLPVPGGGDFAGTLPVMYDKLRTIDFAMVPGRGVFGHPKGPRAGAMSLRQAWDAISQKISLADYAQSHPELSAAIEVFGNGDVPAKDNKSESPFQSIARGFTGASLLIGRN